MPPKIIIIITMMIIMNSHCGVPPPPTPDLIFSHRKKIKLRLLVPAGPLQLKELKDVETIIEGGVSIAGGLW